MKPQIKRSVYSLLVIMFLVMSCNGIGSTSLDPTEAPVGEVAVEPAAETAPDSEESSEMPPAPDPNTAICDGLTASFSEAFQAVMTTATAPFQEVVSGQVIDGCLSKLTKPGENFSSLEDVNSLADGIMQANGWQGDLNYDAGGPGAVMRGYRQNDNVCALTTAFGPVDDALCSPDEPFVVCMDRLTPDQIIYTVSLNCAIVASTSPDTEYQARSGYPLILPPAFDPVTVESLVTATEIPLMIPNSFNIGDEFALYPYIMTMEKGLYEISMDFGEECKGATACHFGVLGGSLSSGNEMFSTPNIVVDMSRAEPVVLANGIQGYFIEGQCGASCDNSLIVWAQDFYQFIIGSKGANKSFMLDLVNLAVTNQTP